MAKYQSGFFEISSLFALDIVETATTHEVDSALFIDTAYITITNGWYGNGIW
jgi:hypothetical protein